jgi:hypothetical protein
MNRSLAPYGFERIVHTGEKRQSLPEAQQGCPPCGPHNLEIDIGLMRKEHDDQIGRKLHFPRVSNYWGFGESAISIRDQSLLDLWRQTKIAKGKNNEIWP